MAILERIQPSIGTGIYDNADVSRLLETPRSTVAGWIRGYTYQALDGIRKSDPVVTLNQRLLTFYDLIELFIVRQYRNAGVPLKEIREVGAALRERLNTPYPFASRRLWVDGKKLLEDYGLEYRHPSSGQVVFGFAKRFFSNLEFVMDMPTKYYPLGPNKLIVVDPEMRFGQPVIKGTRTTSRSVFNAWSAELGDYSSIATWFNIPDQAVRDAVEVESKWAKVA